MIDSILLYVLLFSNCVCLYFLGKAFHHIKKLWEFNNRLAVIILEFHKHQHEREEQ